MVVFFNRLGIIIIFSSKSLVNDLGSREFSFLTGKTVALIPNPLKTATTCEKSFRVFPNMCKLRCYLKGKVLLTGRNFGGFDGFAQSLPN